MQRLLKMEELNSELTPHSLRHTHTSLLAQDGVSSFANNGTIGSQGGRYYKKYLFACDKRDEKEASQKFKELMENL